MVSWTPYTSHSWWLTFDNDTQFRALIFLSKSDDWDPTRPGIIIIDKLKCELCGFGQWSSSPYPKIPEIIIFGNFGSKQQQFNVSKCLLYASSFNFQCKMIKLICNRFITSCLEILKNLLSSFLLSTIIYLLYSANICIQCKLYIRVLDGVFWNINIAGLDV